MTGFPEERHEAIRVGREDADLPTPGIVQCLTEDLAAGRAIRVEREDVHRAQPSPPSGTFDCALEAVHALACLQTQGDRTEILEQLFPELPPEYLTMWARRYDRGGWLHVYSYLDPERARRLILLALERHGAQAREHVEAYRAGELARGGR